MKCYMVADQELPEHFRFCLLRRSAREYVKGQLKTVWTRMDKKTIRKLGYKKKLPTGKQVIVVHLTLK